MPTFIYTPTIAMPHTPPYKIHKYFARRPYNVFMELIQSFSDKDEIIVDPFCGGGVTIYEGLKLNRRVVGFDLNPLSTFIVRNMLLSECANQAFYKAIEDLRNFLHSIIDKFCVFTVDDIQYRIDWAELAMSIRCPHCHRNTPLSNSLKIKNGQYKCFNEYCPSHHNNESIAIKNCERSESQYLFFVHESKGKRIVKEFDSSDKSLYDEHIRFLKGRLKQEKITVPQDLIPMDWDRQFEDGLSQKGIIFFQDFFTKRNLYILLLLLNRIHKLEERLTHQQYELLRMIFSNVIKDANIMSFTNDGWQSGKPTTWSKHAYWVPNQFCEVSIIPIFEKSVDRILNSVKYNESQNIHPIFAERFGNIADKSANVLLQNMPINQSDLPENSVDAVITDPPYGSNVQYLELSHFWYPWNKDLYDRYPVFELEAVANRKKGFKGAKSQYDYERNLLPVFQYSFRCLKTDRFMTLTFNNKDMSSWLALLFSIFKSGFCFHDLYFQDGVKNYKQTAHTKAEGSPYGDFIYVFQKRLDNRVLIPYEDETSFINVIDEIFERHLTNFEDRNETILTVFTEAIPEIERFAKSYLQVHEDHNLYTHFNKTYLSKLYDNEDK